MAATTNAEPKPGKLSERPGWTELRAAADELHAAELLLGDPLAPARTAVPHLREFWRAMVAAARAAQLGAVQAGAAEAEAPRAWLDAEIPGVDAKARARLGEHWRALAAADSEPPADGALIAHAQAARELLQRIEPIIGGSPLRTRTRRTAWTALALVILFGPLLGYVALHTEVEGEGPWRVAYHSDRKLESRPIVQREPHIDHDWNKDAPLEAVPPDKFSVRFDTCLRIDEAGPVAFQVNANDGARVFIDGESVIDAWERDEKTRKRGSGAAEVPLEPGVHHVRVEYFESLGVASIKFSASLDGAVPKPLPHDRLTYPGDDLDEDDPCAAVR
ncbi:PA14 domain protein [Enhygromyxa salina]|uniref:PA14 domain protein n=1 Tax=Enhygromyxa salina TaxID=215803 RepID=A0A2S9YD94_9BACT|nr:PA14 domain-containing protein [Enhygromyxa salina]PRQ03079.1 PA14 domain protein [Enhygromyxa salina]